MFNFNTKILSLLFIFLFCFNAEAANRFWVASAGTYSGNINDTNHWSTTSGGAGGSALPTNADDVFFDGVGSSGGDKTITLNANQSWRSFDMTGGGAAGIIITHNAAVTITVGAASSTGLKFEAGGTYTAASGTTSQFALTNVGSVLKDFTSAGYTFGTITINNNGGATWQLADNLSAANISQGGGTFNTNAKTVNLSTGLVSSNAATRTLTITNSTINISVASGSSGWSLATSTNLTFTATGSTINFTGNGNKTFSWGTALTYGSVVITGSGTNTENASGVTFANFTRTGTAIATDTELVNTNVTITGTLTLTGNSIKNRIGYIGTNSGSGITVTANAVALTNVDIEGVTAAGVASPFTGTSLSNCTGNSNITFDSPRTLYYVGDIGNWSATTSWSLSSGGASGNNPPLCQDTALFNNSSWTTPNAQVTMDVLRYGIQDYSAITSPNPDAPFFRFSINIQFYGNWTLSPVFTGLLSWDNALGGTISWQNMGSVTFTDATVPVGTGLTIAAPGGIVVWGDDVTLHTVLSVTSGTLDTNNKNTLTRGGISTTGALTRAINLRSGTITFNGVIGGTMWTASGTNLTITAGTSTMNFDPENSGGDGLTYTFAGGGFTYGNLTLSHTNATNNKLTVTGANTFATISSTGKGTIALPASTTTTATGLSLHGTDGSNLLSLVSSSGGNAATLSIVSGILSNDYLSIQDSTATGGASFYAGSHSTNVSGNTGWTFTDAPSAGFVSTMLLLQVGNPLGGSPPPSCSNALDFSFSCNSQYLPAIGF